MSTDIIHNEFPVLTGQPSNYYKHRKTALRWIQKLSGKVWTDYNAHDPGITILEVLCYVLTEVEYKLDFPIEDLLSSSNDAMPFKLEHNAFYLAEDIMTCAPVTHIDYRKLIIDNVSQIHNAWLIPNEDNQERFDVLLLKKQHVEIPDAINAAKDCLKNYRAIGEQPMDIKVVSFAYISLLVDIHITTDADPKDVLAHIFYNLNEHYLNVSPHRQTLSELENQGYDYSAIYDGPRMRNGIILKEYLIDLFKTISTIEIKKIMASISGVKMIDSLLIKENYVPNDLTKSLTYEMPLQEYKNDVEPKQSFDVDPGFVPFFSPYSQFIRNKIKVIKNGKSVEFNPEKVHEIILYIMRRKTRSYILKNHKEVTYQLQAKKRNIDDYHSIKHDFPQAYGLSSNGFSFIQNLDAQSSKHLKGYLLPYEQILANTFKGLSNLWTMFSTIPLNGEFFHHPLNLDDLSTRLEVNNSHFHVKSVPNISIKKVVRDRMRFFKLRDKVLTHLLARFDVHLQDEFEIQIAQTELEYLKHAIKRKEQLLQKIHTLISNRNVYNNDRYENLTSLETELYLYLGISEPPQKPYYQAAAIIIDIIKKTERENDVKGNKPYNDPPHGATFERYQTGHYKKRSKIISELLNLGINKSSYTLEPSMNGEKYHITLNNNDESFSVSLGKKKTQRAALHDVSLFVKKFIEISKASEGFYAIDHIMLDLEVEDRDFTKFRMSFVFPRWTARFQNKSYQKEVERIVIKLIPAHIRGECFWLDLEEMKRFEKVYFNTFNEGITIKKDKNVKHKKKLKTIIKELSIKRNR